MAKLKAHPSIELTARLELNEQELRALTRLAQFKHEDTADYLGEKLTQAFEAPTGECRKGLLSFLQGVERHAPSILNRLNQARSAFNGAD